MLDIIQSYITASKNSTENFNEHYAKYMMDVQDQHLDLEISKLFGSPSLKKLIDIDKEANKLHSNILKGI